MTESQKLPEFQESQESQKLPQSQELRLKKAEKEDLLILLELYTYLHNNPMPALNRHIENTWAEIMQNPNHHILLGFLDEKLISSCIITVIPNLTHHQRPYALIENVITHPAYRNKGHASTLLAAAKNIAIENNCYKIMLMNGSKLESTLDFYRRAGYNSNDKTAFIQWL